MCPRLTALLLFITPLGLAPTIGLAEGCGVYPLTQEQAEYLATNSLEIAIPEGDVPIIERCDIDDNNVVDRRDLDLIRQNRGQPASHPDDPMDWDGNGVIHGRDVGGCASSCNSTGCSVQDENEEDGLQAAQNLEEAEVVGSPAACYQVGDYDGDGAQDLIAIYDYTGSAPRYFDWTLQVLILSTDTSGNVQHSLFPFTGQLSSTTSNLAQHLSLQLPGAVNLHPGSINIDDPGVVSYRNGKPEVLYYFDNNTLAQAFYGIDD